MKKKQKFTKELTNELNRYYFLLQTFEKIIESVENELISSNQWFIFSTKIGRKFLIHLKSFVFNVTQDIINLEIDDINVSSDFDISLLYTNLRLQLDAFSTFYHIFIHDGDWEEKIIRFYLWEMDSLISRQNYSKTKIINRNELIISERKRINDIAKNIKSFEFYQKLNTKEKNKLIKFSNGKYTYANWKFDKTILKKRIAKYSWKELALNTGIKLDIYNDLHDFTSMHVHSNYISVLQNEQLNYNDKHASRMVCLRLSAFIISLFVDDLCSRFKSAKVIIKKLKPIEINIIENELKFGRVENKIKNFA